MKKLQLYDVNYYQDFGQCVRGLAAHGDKKALTSFHGKGERMTRSYAEFCADVRALGEALLLNGFSSGQHIAIAERTVMNGSSHFLQ
jgi:long-subunit acyl-CoA synthetase (AMP-forming)